MLWINVRPRRLRALILVLDDVGQRPIDALLCSLQSRLAGGIFGELRHYPRSAGGAVRISWHILAASLDILALITPVGVPMFKQISALDLEVARHGWSTRFVLFKRLLILGESHSRAMRRAFGPRRGRNR
jgi:hypothetical protein